MDVVIGDEENCLVYLLLFVFRDLNFSRLLFFVSESDYGSVVNFTCNIPPVRGLELFLITFLVLMLEIIRFISIQAIYKPQI